jgi:hypothetical protein
MKKVLFSALGVVGVVVSALAVKNVDDEVYCDFNVPTPPGPSNPCTVTLQFATLAINDNPFLFNVYCTTNKGSFCTQTTTVYEAD